MAWEKHSKKITELKESNTQIDMKVRERLEKMIGKVADKDVAVSLGFLKDYLHLRKEDDDAIDELKFHVNLMDDEIRYSVIADDNDQSIYIYFRKEKGED
ncbi:MAG: hypothetical protein ACFFEU_11075 [Candidatus Thorarchaeota archaeon]|jgi:hypothetical protein